MEKRMEEAVKRLAESIARGGKPRSEAVAEKWAAIEDRTVEGGKKYYHLADRVKK